MEKIMKYNKDTKAPSALEKSLTLSAITVVIISTAYLVGEKVLGSFINLNSIWP
jgi:Flp pilus assembly pilin Flp